MKGHTKSVLCGIFLVAIVWQGFALADDFNISNFRLAPPGSDEFVGIETTGTLDQNEFAFRTLFDFSDDPLVLFDQSGNRVLSIVDNRINSEVAFGYGFKWLDVGVVLPFTFHQDGPDRPIAGVTNISQGGLGDVRIFARKRILGNGEKGFGLAGSLAVSFPTSSVDFAGEGKVGALPLLIADWRAQYFTLAANVGARIREHETFQGLSMGNALRFGGGAAVKNPWLKKLTLNGEIDGEMSQLKTSKDKIPVEARGGVGWNLFRTLNLETGYGRGLTSGYGGVNYRVFLALTYRPVRPEKKFEPWTTMHIRIDGDRIIPSEEITFIPESDEIHPTSQPILDEVKQTLNANPWIKKVQIEAYTDPGDSPASALNLALRRAEAVRRALVALGVGEDRVLSKGFLAYGRGVAQTTEGESSEPPNTVRFHILEGVRPEATPEDTKAKP